MRYVVVWRNKQTGLQFHRICKDYTEAWFYAVRLIARPHRVFRHSIEVIPYV